MRKFFVLLICLTAIVLAAKPAKKAKGAKPTKPAKVTAGGVVVCETEWEGPFTTRDGESFCVYTASCGFGSYLDAQDECASLGAQICTVPQYLALHNRPVPTTPAPSSPPVAIQEGITAKGGSNFKWWASEDEDFSEPFGPFEHRNDPTVPVFEIFCGANQVVANDVAIQSAGLWLPTWGYATWEYDGIWCLNKYYCCTSNDNSRRSRSRL